MPEEMARPLGGRRRIEATALPGWIKPQLTKLVDQPPDGPEWLHEIKFDGYRMHARLDRATVRLLTRTGLDWTPKYPAIAVAIASLPARQAYLDGELCGVRPDGTTSFSLDLSGCPLRAGQRLTWLRARGNRFSVMIRLAGEQEGNPRSCEPAIPLPGLCSRKAPAPAPRTLFAVPLSTS